MLNVISLLIGVLGIIVAFYFGIKSLRLSREKRTFSWHEVERGATYLLRKAEEVFHPQIIMMISIESAIITGIAMTKFPRLLPTYLVMLENKTGRKFDPTVIPKDHSPIETSKWNIYIPNQVCKEHDKRILIIDDRVLTGNIQREMRKFLESKGFKKENIMFISLVCASTAITSNNAPDLYYYKNPYEEFDFPYGSWAW
jgi:hypothetical protein